MTILVSNNEHLNHMIRHQLRDIVLIINNIYECQNTLSNPDIVCAILILDANLFNDEILFKDISKL